MDLQGHAYVIEQIDTANSWRKPQGNVYPSNVGVIGNSALGISLKKYLDENPNPVDLEGYLDQLAAVSSRDASAQTRLDLYRKMNTAPSYLKNPEVKPLTEQAFSEASASLEVKKLSCQSFQERDVLRGVGSGLGLRMKRAPPWT